MRAHARETGREGNHTKEAEQNDDGVEAGALPVASTEMQPHSELVESKRHANAIEQRTDLAQLRTRPAIKEQQAADRRKKKDTVVEMVHMRSAKMKKEVRNAPHHDEDYEDARGNEGEKKTGESNPTQVSE